MISSNETVEVPHLPDIDQQETEVARPRKLSAAMQHQYACSNSRSLRAASTSGIAPRGVSQNALPRSTSADTISRPLVENSAIYRLDNLKAGNGHRRRLSVFSANSSEGRPESSNRISSSNGSINRGTSKENNNSKARAPITATLGNLLNTLDSRLVTRGRNDNPEAILAMRNCRYIRIYAPGLKHGKAYNRLSSWNMPGSTTGGTTAAPSGGSHGRHSVMSGR